MVSWKTFYASCPCLLVAGESCHILEPLVVFEKLASQIVVVILLGGFWCSIIFSSVLYCFCYGFLGYRFYGACFCPTTSFWLFFYLLFFVAIYIFVVFSFIIVEYL